MTTEQEKQLLEWGEGLSAEWTLLEIQNIEATFDIKFPADYVEIFTQGSIYFDDGRMYEAAWQRFDGKAIALDDVDEIETEYGISTFSSLEQIVFLNQTFVVDAIKRNRPSFPLGMIPFSYGASSEVLLFAASNSDKKPGSVWVWPITDEVWGTGDNIYIGYVADSFTEFLFEKTAPWN
jgi:SMI1 / KNR4 family (SUKH-1)